METASVSELKSRLSEFLRLVRGGGSIMIMDRGKPVAVLRPAQSRGGGKGNEGQAGTAQGRGAGADRQRQAAGGLLGLAPSQGSGQAGGERPPPGSGGRPVIFWDSSAVLPLLFDESNSDAVQELSGQDAAMLVWWGTPGECLAAIARREREGSSSRAEAERQRAALSALSASWGEVLAGEWVREHAGRLV